MHTGSKVRVAPRVNGAGAFGRPSGATDLSTWRKSTAPTPTPTPTKPGTVVADSWLDTVSRSPPPELASNLGNTPSMQADEPATIRPRSQPKMPAGSAVAFYRDTRVDSLESAPKSSVNFTVTSELEDAAQSKLKAGSSKSLPASSPSAKVAIALPSTGAHAISVVSELKSQPASPELVHAVDANLAVEVLRIRRVLFLFSIMLNHNHFYNRRITPPITPPSQSSNANWTKPPPNFPVKDRCTCSRSGASESCLVASL